MEKNGKDPSNNYIPLNNRRKHRPIDRMKKARDEVIITIPEQTKVYRPRGIITLNLIKDTPLLSVQVMAFRSEKKDVAGSHVY